MKKYFSILSAIVLSVFFLTACGSGSGKPSERTATSNLPGKWKVTHFVDTDGKKSAFDGNVIFEFGKLESSSDFGSNHGSIWGYCDAWVNDFQVVNRGTWNMEPVPEDKGIFFYIMDGNSHKAALDNAFYMITSLSGNTMRWEDCDDPSGYIFERVK